MYLGVESSPSTETLNFLSERKELISLITWFENFNFATTRGIDIYMFWFFECGAHEKMFGSYVFAMHEGEQRQ
jgi:hypothetical protein